VEALFSRDVLRTNDSIIAIDVQEVVAGKEAFGGGRLRARVENGRVEVAPLEINVPGGTGTLTFAYEPGEGVVAADARLHIDRFDYGRVARRTRPDTDVAGTFSLDAEITGRAPRLADLLETGTGRIDFAVWPVRMHAGVFDLWATNVLSALLPAVDADASRINCAVGQFDLRDGALTSVRMLIDTTHTRAQGTATANFNDETIRVRLVPRAKVPQFFVLATPIEVNGTFDDFETGVRTGDVLETVIRWLTSIVVVPIQKLIAVRPPADGNDVCVDVARPPAVPSPPIARSPN
jgi:uncharacterized protein involved in outer membrane biogenesis